MPRRPKTQSTVSVRDEAGRAKESSQMTEKALPETEPGRERELWKTKLKGGDLKLQGKEVLAF